MESLAPATNLGSSSTNRANYLYTRSQVNQLVINESFGETGNDTSTAAIDDLAKSLSIKADKIIEKLNEILKAKLPNGVQVLKPEEVTPEATADRIVSQITSLFEVYAKQNPDTDREELLNNFLGAARKGVQQGYDEAFSILEGLGAFEFEGVQAGIEKTKLLIEQKLSSFEAQKREDFGLVKLEDIQKIQNTTSSELLQQVKL